MDTEVRASAEPSGTRMSGRRNRRAEIVRGLRERTSASAAELADGLGVHPNTIRFHLAGLERDGEVVRERQSAQAPGRPELRFRLSPAAEPATERADLLARILLSRLAAAENPEAEAEAAGHQWGSAEAQNRTGARTEAVDDLVRMLEESGFAPARRGGSQIDLLSCPLRQFLGTHGRLVCAIHRGMMTGFLDAVGSPNAVESLTPFATATSCSTRLQTR